ncbi:superoxide dismutase family protein [Maricaulis sp.]|uniref:superoxide dismutase family protein n=1 Tax=Maricaulis sp. TaxID=1486257 RepID=UPI002621BAAB|nr:superoxide dismutase family protein [Maricaulis sp.]
MFNRLIPAIAFAALMAAATPAQPAAPQPVTARVPITGAGNGDPISGMAILREGPEGVLIRIRVNDLPVEARGRWHAAHLHDTADCTGTGFTRAGDHINQEGRAHGLLNLQGPEPADLPNLWADAAGNINAELYSTGITLTGAAGRVNLLDEDGSAIVLHAGADDHTSQPIGGAGARIACGTISGG